MADNLTAIINLVLELEDLGILAGVLNLGDESLFHLFHLLLLGGLTSLQVLYAVLDEFVAGVDILPVEEIVHILVILGVEFLNLLVDGAPLLLGGVHLHEEGVLLFSRLFLLLTDSGLAFVALLEDLLDDVVDSVPLLIEGAELLDEGLSQLGDLVALDLDLEVALCLRQGAVQGTELLDELTLLGACKGLVVQRVLDVFHLLLNAAGLALAAGDVLDKFEDLFVELLELDVVLLLSLGDGFDLVAESLPLLEVDIIAERCLLVLLTLELSLLVQLVIEVLAVFEEFVDGAGDILHLLAQLLLLLLESLQVGLLHLGGLLGDLGVDCDGSTEVVLPRPVHLPALSSGTLSGVFLSVLLGLLFGGGVGGPLLTFLLHIFLLGLFHFSLLLFRHLIFIFVRT